MHRYIAFICGSRADSSVRSMRLVEANLSNSAPEWSWAEKSPDMLIAHTGSRPRLGEAYPLGKAHGVALGTLFRRSDLGSPFPSRVRFDDDETHKVLNSICRHLVAQYWGKYVAFVRDSARHTYHVLRDPTAQICCYRTTWNGIDVFFSHIEDCLRFVPMSFSINWNYVTASLLAGRHSMRDCGLNNIEDIPGGELQSMLGDGRVSRTTLWSPADFCREGAIEDQATARDALRSTVQNTVNAWASCSNNIALSLSGGLDSSIVAGCLSQAPNRPEVTCLNHFLTISLQEEELHLPTLSRENIAKARRMVGGGHGDERYFAKLVAERWRYPLLEQERRISDIDLRQLADAPMSPIPTSFIGSMDLDDANTRIVQERRADTFFTGLGGDTVFYCTFQSLGAVDYARLHGLGSGFVKEIGNACTLSKESAWRVLSKSVRFGLLRQQMPKTVDTLLLPHLLTEQSASSVRGKDIEHPWAIATDRLPPGKKNQVIGLAHSALFYHFEFRRDRHAASVNPLCAQPVVEVCLRIPTYTLLAGGVSRGLARLAFADLLPHEILRRTFKGTGAAFFQKVTRVNMPFIRDTLLNGALVSNGILDAKKVQSYLVEGQQFTTVDSGQILHYLATEAWINQWAPMANRAAA